ncbi:MAG: outer membrane beta-barrel protein, partial [Alphaproteobacteria bacterium]|nr:outer membrane beta-barrel protein [Alphaproteobacteria bacterium]
ANTTSFGGFFGWQKQFDQVVVGFEGNYNRTNINAAAMDQIGRSFTTSDGYFNDVVVTASSALHITDYGTIRLKGGWAIDCLMPYMFVGLALGRGDFSRSAHVVTNSFDPSGIKPPTHLDQSQTDNRAGAMAYGFAGGFGLDYAIYQSFFVRAEYEYVQLNAFDLKTNIQTARIGAGFKF